MSEAKTIDSVTDEPSDYKNQVAEYIEKIDRIRRQMAQDEKQINNLRAETREILTRLEAA
jgi:uncharacterized coiled-coil DUF342 family protein